MSIKTKNIAVKYTTNAKSLLKEMRKIELALLRIQKLGLILKIKTT